MKSKVLRWSPSRCEFGSLWLNTKFRTLDISEMIMKMETDFIQFYIINVRFWMIVFFEKFNFHWNRFSKTDILLWNWFIKLICILLLSKIKIVNLYANYLSISMLVIFGTRATHSDEEQCGECCCSSGYLIVN